MRSKRGKVTLFAKGERVVDGALAERRSGKPERAPAWYGQLLRPDKSHPEARINPQLDMMSLLRHVTIVEGIGRSITQTLEANVRTLGYEDERARQHARGVALTLQTWCSSRRLPPLIEAITQRSAKAFMRNLANRGKARRTIENYRTVLSRLWEHVASREAEFIRSSKHPESFACSTLLENPWDGLPVPKQKRTPTKSDGYSGPKRDQRGLGSGPIAVARMAMERAYRLKPMLRRFSADGITSNIAIARALNELGVKTPRGKLWDATGVRRLKERCGWSRK